MKPMLRAEVGMRVRCANKAIAGRFNYTDTIRDKSSILKHTQVAVEIFEELELIQTQMAQKPMLRAEVGMRVRCANKASAE
jgi:hypothetical protein